MSEPLPELHTPVNHAHFPGLLDRRLLANFSYLGAANLFYALSQWGMLVVTTKLGSVAMTAQLSLGLAVAVPVMIFMGAGLRTVITADVQQRFRFGEYFSARLGLSLIGLLGVILFGVLSRYSTPVLWTAFLVGGIKFIEGLQEICWGVSQRHEQMRAVGISRILRGVTALVGLAVAIFFTDQLWTGIYLWGLAWIGILFLYDLPRARKLEALQLSLDWPKWKAIILQAAPLAVVWGLISLNDKAPQYLLSWFEGEESVGYFAPIAYVLQGLGMGMSAAGEAMIPRLARSYHTDRARYLRSGLRLAGFGALLGAAGLIFAILFGKPVLVLLYRPEYAAYAPVLTLLMVVGILRFAQAGIGTAVTAAGLFQAQVPVFGLTLLVTLLAGWLLVPSWGLVGAAAAIGAGLLVSLTLLLVLFFRHAKD